MRTSALSFAFLGLGLCFTLSCTRAPDAVLTIQLPQAETPLSKGQTILAAPTSGQQTGFNGTFDDDVPWNGESISLSSQINCYAVMVGGPEPIMKRNSCWDSSYKDLVQFGDYEGGIPAGSRIEITVPPGSNRQIYLLGMNAANGACQSFKNNNLKHDLISFPRLVAQTTMDLNPGTNLVTLTIPENLSSSPKIQDCRTDENSGASHIRPGDKLSDGTIYLGTLKPGATSGGSNVDRYVTTPGNCSDSGTPICDGGMDTLIKMWSGTNTDISGIENYADNIGVGYGETNTDQNYGDANTAAMSSLSPAASYCSNLDYGGHNDWFLPNRYELNLMFKNKDRIPGLVTNASGNDSVYWSSSESNDAEAWSQKISTGSQIGNSPKSYSFLVRCVRRMQTPILLISSTSSITNLDVDGSGGGPADSSKQLITITNKGELTTGVLTTIISGESLEIVSGYDDCTEETLDPGESCTLKVRATGLLVDRLINGTLTVSEANGGSVSVSLSGAATGFGGADSDCTGNESVGQSCGGAIYMGQFNSHIYMTTPGGCQNSTTNPTCEGADSLIKNWQESLDYCANLEYGGHTDWYLPNREELNFLYLKRSALPGVKPGLYWSSSENGDLTSWRQNFSNGAPLASFKDEGKYVRCVRSYTP
jgi:hypothetical protein